MPNKKQKAVREENDRLMELFSIVDKNRLDFVRDHVQQLAWLNVSIKELQASIDKNGTTLAYNNGGGQTGVRQNPDLKTLSDFQKLVNSIVRNLLPLVPVAAKKSTFALALEGALSSIDYTQ